MGEKMRSILKTLAKNKKRKGTHLKKKKTIRDEKRPLNSKIDSDDVNEEERVPEEEESEKNEDKLPDDFEEDERNLVESAAAADDDGENSELKMESQRRPKKKKKKMKKSRLCPHGNIIKDQSYYDRLHAKYPKMLPYIQKVVQSAPKKKMNPGPIPYYEASPIFIKEAMKQMKMKEESEKTTEKKKDVSVSKAQETPKPPRCLTWDHPPTTWNPASIKKVPFVFPSRPRCGCKVWT